MNKPISCELFDYIEIACMFSYRVELLFYSGEQIQGIPVTTRTTHEKQELLVFNTENHAQSQLEIDTSTIKSMTVLTPEARFKQVHFD